MEDIKHVVAKNIANIRLRHRMTQMELAKQLNYSDKAISKWERGESLPDISVLVGIADLFQISLDDLVRPEGVGVVCKKEPRINRSVLVCMIEAAVWLLPVFAFVITGLALPKSTFRWLYFLYTLPIVFILRLVLNSIWLKPKHNYWIISALMWSALICIQVSLWYFGLFVPSIYLLGVVGQVIVVLSAYLKKDNNKKAESI